MPFKVIVEWTHETTEQTYPTKGHAIHAELGILIWANLTETKVLSSHIEEI